MTCQQMASTGYTTSFDPRHGKTSKLYKRCTVKKPSCNLCETNCSLNAEKNNIPQIDYYQLKLPENVKLSNLHTRVDVRMLCCVKCNHKKTLCCHKLQHSRIILTLGIKYYISDCNINHPVVYVKGIVYTFNGHDREMEMKKDTNHIFRRGKSAIVSSRCSLAASIYLILVRAMALLSVF